MKFNRRFVIFEALLLGLALLLSGVGSRLRADSGTCSGQTITLPFTDVPATNIFFCSIAQIYFQAITFGTSPTTYGPADNVTREQMAAFLSRTQNSVLNRGSRRAALNQLWTTTPHYTITQGAGMLGTTPAGSAPINVASDGADLWVTNSSGEVTRVRASDGKLLETWIASTAAGVLVAMGRVFVTGRSIPGRLYAINPSQAPGVASLFPIVLGNSPEAIAFDGEKIWTANDGSVSIITPGANFTVINIPGFGNLTGVVYDGANIWVTEEGAPGLIKKLDGSGVVIDTATVGHNPQYPIFDGTNIWVPNQSSSSVSVVRASDGEVLSTLTGNGLSGPRSAAFDGQRILVTNPPGNSASLFRATDLAPLGSFSTGANSNPFGACSDELHFWIVLLGPNQLARF